MEGKGIDVAHAPHLEGLLVVIGLVDADCIDPEHAGLGFMAEIAEGGGEVRRDEEGVVGEEELRLRALRWRTPDVGEGFVGRWAQLG